MNIQAQLIEARGNMFKLMGLNRQLKDKVEYYEQIVEDMQQHINVLTQVDDKDFMREEPDYKDVNRFEVIDSTGRAYTQRLFSKMEFSRQDNGKTLKIFLNKP